MPMSKYGSKGRNSIQSAILFFSQFLRSGVCPYLLEILYSWILNRRKAALVFVHLLEQISIFIQIPFESSLIPSILYFYKAKVPLKVVHHGIFSVMNLMWPRCSVCHWHLIPLGMTELGRVLIVWFKHAAQSSPHCSLHICMPEIRWQSAFWSHEAPYQLWDGHVSNCVAGKEPWCSGERGKRSRLPWRVHQQKTCSIFILILSWERSSEHRWQKYHD